MTNRVIVALGVGLLLGAQAGCSIEINIPSINHFHVTGDVFSPQRWTAEQFRRAMADDVTDGVAKNDNREIHFRGVPLTKVIEHAAPLHSLRKHGELALAVLVEGRDGYSAAFSLFELKKDLGGKSAYVVMEKDGVTLDKDHGPVSLIVIGDETEARWVYGICNIRVIDLAEKRNR